MKAHFLAFANKRAFLRQLSVLHLKHNRTLVSGVLLKNKPFTAYAEISRIQNFFKVIQSYFIGVLRHEKIVISVDRHQIPAETDKNGAFRLIIPFLAESEGNLFGVLTAFIKHR